MIIFNYCHYFFVCRLVCVFCLFFLQFSVLYFVVSHFFFFKQKTAYDMRISDWSSDVCSSDLLTHDYKRHGTTTLFAALNVLDGTVIGQNMQRHRHQEFIRFLNRIEREVPTGKAIHVILDNYAAHKKDKVQRSEERREGNECVSTCRSRRSRDHKKKKTR